MPIESAFSAVDSDTGLIDANAGDEVAIVNGVSLPANSHPSLTAIVSARGVSIRLNREWSISGHFFGHGLNHPFSGPVSDCGMATDVCANTPGRICLIESDNRLVNPLSPSVQLSHCATGGGIGAVFHSETGVLPRTDLFDGMPQIPAVFISESFSADTLASVNTVGLWHLDVEPITSEKILCGATHIGDAWVLTAAHCVLEQTPDGLRQIQPWEITASVGAHDLREDKHLAQAVERIFVAGSPARRSDLQHDIALLKLAQIPRSIASDNDNVSAWQTDSVTVKIASDVVIGEQLEQSAQGLVLGWGSTRVREANEEVSSADISSSTPRAAMVTLVPQVRCRGLWTDYLQASNIAANAVQIDDRVLCAHDPVARQDTCQGDSGGPLLINDQDRWKLAGITSFGLGCGSLNTAPAVYTRVSEYTDWISSTTGMALSDNASLPVTVNSMSANLARVQVGSEAGGIGKFGSVMLLQLLCFIPLIALYGCQKKTVGLSESSAEKMDLRIHEGGLKLGVISTGCTQPEHFAVREGVERCTFVVERLQPDYCKRASFITRISIDWQNTECDEREVVFVNPGLTE